MDQHPADREKPDDDGGACDGPGADADVADGLAFSFVPRDLAIALLGVFFSVVHGPPHHARHFDRHFRRG